ncbi:MAG: threonine synthase [Chitinophagaceae bacterium]|nr:threonine synthase [Chitinophagaceae bacterium]
MQYYSLNRQSPDVDFKEAALVGQALDKGLYFPEKIAQLPADFIQNLKQFSKEEVAYQILSPYTGNTIPADILKQIIKETISFDIPLVKVSEDIFSLELFHGPTLAFKDVGARFISRCLGYFSKETKKEMTVLVATSGDTGGAVASGFYNIEGVKVVILYPSGKVSDVQELQLTTHGKNIHALEVAGNFDDCQRMVKQAFVDEDLKNKMFLTSANSINIARWLPQQVYYAFALQQWSYEQLPVVSVPSGNFGNICAGLLLHFSGLPVKHFIAACNANDTVLRFLKTTIYQPGETISTLSNAMDVSDPSNFIRVLELFEKEGREIKKLLSSYTISDEETKSTMRAVFEKHDYILDPHGAVAFTALERYLSKNRGVKGIFLETAHPVKFRSSTEQAINAKISISDDINALLQKVKQSKKIPADYSALRNFLWNDL